MRPRGSRVYNKLPFAPWLAGAVETLGGGQCHLFITEHLGSCSGLLPRAPSSLFPPTRLLSLPGPLLSALASSVLNCSCPQGFSRRGQADRSHTVASGAGITILTRTFQARTPPLRWGGEETHSRAHSWLVAELGLDPTQVHGMFC